MEVDNKVYGLKAWGKFTTAFETKEDVEDYLKICQNVISIYNPNEDSWNTSGEFSILPLRKEFVDTLKLHYYKSCNENQESS